MALTPAVKKEIVAKYGSSATDTGSPEAQVALLSRRIEDITTHLKTNPHDHHNRRGLLLLVGQRRRKSLPRRNAQWKERRRKRHHYCRHSW
jgi:small subunit ribosomal protein S15